VPDRPDTIAVTIAEPFEVALRMVRRSLAMEGLRVPAEIDIAARTLQELGVELMNSVTLFVDTPALLLEAVRADPAGALTIPQSLALYSRGETTRAVFRLQPAYGPARELQIRMTAALERIGSREIPLKAAS